MFTWLFGPKEEWRLVKTITDDIEQRFTKRNGKLYYHLFESNKGNRTVEFACTLDINKEQLCENAKRLITYQEKIFRWVNGRVDPDIPTYNQVPEEETIAVLKGTI
jgi:hypothetical protein